ncbi:MAG: DUF5686 and carboxypeptidase regulatory-like domain-containing protein [Nonlabens sp.]|nr:DUF5686 and carboxypeptidase regulatory-like domain-containing protein [Nonlabens sp.]
MIRFFLYVAFAFFSTIALAQNVVSGIVTDAADEPIAFASIYIKGSYTGTTTNVDGSYSFKVPAAGSFEITYQSLGYKSQTITVVLAGKEITKDIKLEEEQTSLATIVVNSGENPANRVIREAIKNREANRKKFSSYTADFYSRGLWKMEDVPEKLFGQEIGDLDGSLDSLSRSGIVYLSETVSEIAYNAPNDFKETIIASKISGDDNGFSVNTAESANFDFYNNNIDLNNRIVSPIADYAFNYYNYKLLGTFYDDNKFLINKIEVKSKRPKDNTFDGIIYIVEDQWTIDGLELSTAGENINVPVIKKLTFVQDFTFEPSSGDWVKRSQTIDFAFGLFGFNGTGRFFANYTSYNFKPEFTKKSFGPEVLSFKPEANKKDAAYWNEKRPVPLTFEENKDYIKKDSISAVRNDPKYKDSVDRVNNKFKFLKLLTGYTYRNSNKNERYSYDGVLGLGNFKGFNTVQGFVIGSGFSYSKGFDDDYNRSLYIGSNINYGVSDDRLRYDATASYRFNRTNRRSVSLSAGTQVRQINNNEPINTLENTVATLFLEQNFAKFYEVDFVRAGYSEEVANGFYISASAGFEQRQGLDNTTDQTFYPRADRSYTINNPVILGNNRLAIIDDHDLVKVGLGLTIRPGQKFQSYPDQKFNITNEKYPTISLIYEGGFAASRDGYDFHQFSASVYQGFDMGNLGRSSYWVNAGTFVDGENISFVDYQHFNGNRLRLKTSALNQYGFGLLPYYDYSTSGDYAQIHLQHDFKGFILGKIPGINRLNYDLILSGKALFTDQNPYFEVSAGIDNIGFGKFRPFRLDYVRSITSDRNYGAFILGVNFGL